MNGNTKEGNINDSNKSKGAQLSLKQMKVAQIKLTQKIRKTQINETDEVILLTTVQHLNSI